VIGAGHGEKVTTAGKHGFAGISAIETMRKVD
jgi:hypothetical protein